MSNKYLDILELQPGATKKDLKAAYRRLSKRYHPDINKEANAEEKFIEIAEAYNFLTHTGPKPNNEQTTYDYDPFVTDYELWRQAARAKAKQRAREKYQEEVAFIADVTNGFNVVVIIFIVFNILLLLDYALPRKTYNQRIDVAKISNIYTDATIDSYVFVGYNFDEISLEDFNITYEKNVLPNFNHYERAAVITTPIFKKPTSIIIVRDGIIEEYSKPYNIYRYFKVIPFMLMLLVAYGFIKNIDQKLGLAIVLIIFVLYEMLMFFGF